MSQGKIWKKRSGAKTGSWIFYLLFVLISVSSSAQKISEAKYTYYISDVEYEIIQLNIHNDTREKMLLWLEKDTAIQKKPINDKVRNYFFSVKGDFSLVMVITEYGSTLTGFETDLFFTFYKMIEPQKSFLIQVICKNPNNKNIVKLLKEMIITATPMQMEKERMNIFEIAGLEQLSFRFNTLVIDGQTLIPYVNRQKAKNSSTSAALTPLPEKDDNRDSSQPKSGVN